MAGARRLTVWVLTAVAPLVVLAASVAVALSWSARLPSPVATHWGADGVPDGFGSLAGLVALTGTIGVVLVAGSTAVGVRLGHQAAVRRIAAGFSTGMAVFLSGVMLGSLVVQLDLPEARRAPGVAGLPLTVGVLAALALGATAAALVPGDPRITTDRPVPPSAARASLTPGTAVGWARTVTSPALGWVAGAVLALGVLGSVLPRLPVLLVVMVPVAAVMIGFTVVRVGVDETGLTVRWALGWPATRVRLDELVEARVTDVDPLREFGGWGFRIGAGGRTGWVLRRGPALEVIRTGERVLVVTVDDAAGAAALLNTLADRQRPTRA